MYPYNTPYRTTAAPGHGREILTTDKMFLDLLLEAMADEATDIQYYDRLRNLTVDADDKEVIRCVRMDEQKHLKALTDVYQTMSGDVPMVVAKEKPLGNNAHTAYGKSVFNELEGMEFYRKLYFMSKEMHVKDVMFELMTDEMAHSVKMQHLFSKSACQG